jgi:alkylated DNA nucleotide flippase Atl1
VAHLGCDDEIKTQIMRLLQRVPAGKVISYGMLGKQCRPAISGYFCGRMMSRLGGDAPWWRVVAATGRLPASERSPQIGREQRELLEQEGVSFDGDGKVEKHCFITSVGESGG